MLEHTPYEGWWETRLQGVVGCVLRTILWPTDKLLSHFLPVLHAMDATRPAPVIAMHVRTGDLRMFDAADALALADIDAGMRASLAACAGDAAGTRVLFVSDSRALRASARAAYGPRLIDTNVTANHIDWGDPPRGQEAAFAAMMEAAMRDAFGEWFLLSLADGIITDGGSGYSRTAGVFKGYPHFLPYDAAADTCVVPAADPKYATKLRRIKSGVRRRVVRRRLHGQTAEAGGARGPAGWEQDAEAASGLTGDVVNVEEG
jgi:hypothetical protein